MTGSDVPRWPPEDPTPGHNHVYIAVMGVTGAGKSTLISHCTQSEVEVGHDLEGCTQVVSSYPVKYNENTTVWLVDTPGFDDTSRSDTEVLREVATWLSNAYKDTKHLHGIIYLHRIRDTRLGGSAMRNLFMFQKLCGQDALKNVILATTMWEDVKEGLGNKREEELKNKTEFWGGMMNKGSAVLRHQNTQESALRLVEHFVEKPPGEATTVLDLQKEMVDLGRSLDQTGAGQEVDGGLAKQRESQKSHLETLQKDLEEARASNDSVMARMLEEERTRAQTQMADLVQQREDLKVNLERLWEAKLAQLKTAHAAQIEEMEKIRKGEKIQHGLNVEEYMHSWQQHFGGEGPSPADMDKGVSLSLFGDRYWFDAPRFDFGNPTADIPMQRHPFPTMNGNSWVAWGEHNSWYIRYRESYEGGYRYRSSFSDNFQEIYPGAYRFLFAQYPDENPTCVSLATGGHYFVATVGHISHNLPLSVRARLSAEPNSYECVWLGEGETFVSQRLVQSTNGGTSYAHECYLKPGYPALEAAVTARDKDIKLLALNPLDSQQYAILWSDGSARYSPGSMGFETSIFQKWCTNNFGTSWESSNATVGESMKPDVKKPDTKKLDTDFLVYKLGSRKWYAPWKRGKGQAAAFSTATNIESVRTALTRTLF